MSNQIIKIFSVSFVFLFILTLGCKQSSKDDLWKAIDKGDYEEVEKLVNKYKISLGIKWEGNCSPAEYAALRGKITITRFLLEKSLDSLGKKDIQKIFNASVLNGDIYSLELLIKKGANINAKDSKGVTPLMKVSGLAVLPAVKLLIKNGANVNAVNNAGETALSYATRHGTTEIMHTLLDNGADIKRPNKNLLFECIKGDRTNIDKIELLLENNVNINTKEPTTGYPLIFWVVMFANNKAIETILKAKPNINVQFNRKTVLDYAIKNKKKDTINLLRKYGGKTAKELKSSKNP